MIVDSPRERAKLRSAAATHSNARSGPSTSRLGPTMSASRRPTSTTGGTPASKPQLVDRNGRPTASREVAPAKRPVPAAPTTIMRGREQQPASANAIAGRVAKCKTEDYKTAAPTVPARTAKAPSTVPPKPTPKRTVKTPEPRDTKADSGVGESYTPPGNPTRLPSPIKSPSKTRLVIPVTPAPKKTAPPTKTPAADATRIKTVLPLKTPVNRRMDPRDPNAMRTPSKEIESSLNRAIDAKIAEYARSGKEFTPSGNRISELLEAKRGQQSSWIE
ncbi:hypothetical protein N0V94_000160 [Neodidymelliopsis sp. IMI 364377]|nr:hypothetical protein N0V94_000160 [Neodidymelliopsis sp. IMI 364377]